MPRFSIPSSPLFILSLSGYQVSKSASLSLDLRFLDREKRPRLLVQCTICFAGKDQGINIRHKVTDMIDFIQDDDRLREDRKKAKKNKDKYVGMSSDAMGGYGGSGWNNSSWQDNWPRGGGGGGG